MFKEKEFEDFVAGLNDLDPSVMDWDELSELFSGIKQVRAALDAYEARITATLNNGDVGNAGPLEAV